MKKVKKTWFQYYSPLAMTQGWDIFEVSGSSYVEDGTLQIQRIDDPESVAEELGIEKLAHKFKSDDTAEKYVKRMARKGLSLYKRALEEIEKHNHK